jgi:hypothetical protein
MSCSVASAFSNVTHIPLITSTDRGESPPAARVNFAGAELPPPQPATAATAAARALRVRVMTNLLEGQLSVRPSAANGSHGFTAGALRPDDQRAAVEALGPWPPGAR